MRIMRVDAAITLAITGMLISIAACSTPRLPAAGHEPVGPPQQRLTEAAPGDALRLRAPRAPQPSLESAKRARAAFWEAFEGQRYEAIPGLLRQLSAAFLENPRDPETALILAHTHLWRIAERGRLPAPDPTITDHLVLAEHYFEEAYRLNPDDHRILGWLGSVRAPLGATRQDPEIAAEGARLLEEGVLRYHAFNLFTAAYSRSGLPATDERFIQALQMLWRNIEECSGVLDDAAASGEIYERAARADRACANSQKAPHNFEGFVLNLGDMVVKTGDATRALAIYERARLAPTYGDWPYRDLLEARIAGAEQTAARALRGEPTPLMIGSQYACAACHARK